MSERTFTSIHVIGLGGTGTNIVESLITSKRFSQLLASEDFSIACLALDVADADLANLQKSNKQVQSELESKGISVDRLWVKGLNIKFSTPDALFEFMGKYNAYLMKDGIHVNNYKPWIASSMSIPPLAGGVGRMRALSKAVYNLNYYHYMELNNVMSVFKDKVLTSKNQPIVVLVFGLGGGTGSGMLFDFARHLRLKLGSSIPIIGLCVLPSIADDLLARGPASFTSLSEADLLFNLDLNERVVKEFGEAYRNPFTSLFFVPLEPVYNNRSNLVNAKKELDDAIVDTLYILSTFDLADLLSRLGTNNNFGPNWVHTMAYLKIRYPVDDYVNYFHEYLRLTELIGTFMNLKKEALLRINETLSNRFLESKELYRRHLVSMNRYSAETFEKDIEDVIHRAGKFDSEYKRQVKGLEDFAARYSDSWSKVLQAMVFSDESAEYSVIFQVKKWNEQISHIGRSYEELQRELSTSLSDLEDSLTASKLLTSSQIRQIRSYISFVYLINTALETLSLYIRAKAVGDEVAVLNGKDKGAVSGNGSKGTRGNIPAEDTHLLPLFRAAGYILTRPETEVKVSDQYIPGIRVVRKNVDSNYRESLATSESTERLLAQKQIEISRIQKEIQKVRLDVAGKKKLMQKSLNSLQNDSAALSAQLSEQRAESDRLRIESEKLADLESELEMASQYHKTLNQIVNKTNELNSLMSAITATGSYYERVVELSEAEQVKIMEKILREQEEVLKGEGILKEIVDKDRFRSIVRSYMRIFSIANYAGLSDNFRTDLIWATVGIPSGLWDQELQGSLANSLNVFSSIESSKSISIRQLNQIDPWTITFLIILAKARTDQIEKYTSMKNDTEAVSKSERVLFRSFLLEQGIQNIDELIMKLEQEPAHKVEE
jgi:hypothetical protein